MQTIEIAGLVSVLWPESEWITAVAVILGESDGNEKTHYYNPTTHDDSYGLAQINMRGNLGPSRRATYGLSSNDELFDPYTNLRIAYDIWLSRKSFRPWGAYTDGGYKKYGRYEKAQEAVRLHRERIMAKPPIKKFVDVCQQQRGEPYVFGAEVNQDGSLVGTQRWDCSELTSVAAHKVGGFLPDGSIAQWDYCRSHGLALSVAKAIQTFGALLFIHESGHHHVAVSLGNGTTIEARGRAYGVGNFTTSGRGWTSGGKIPTLDYTGGEEDVLNAEDKEWLRKLVNDAALKILAVPQDTKFDVRFDNTDRRLRAIEQHLGIADPVDG